MRAIEVPVAVVALRDDPLHPLSVATAWAGLIPRAELVVLDRAQPGEGLPVFARSAARAFDALSDYDSLS